MLDSARRYDVNDTPLKKCPHCSTIFTASDGLQKLISAKALSFVLTAKHERLSGTKKQMLSLRGTGG